MISSKPGKPAPITHFQPLPALRLTTKPFLSVSISALLGIPAICVFAVFVSANGSARAQTAPSPAGRQIGTVKTVTPNKLTIATDAGLTISVGVGDDAKVLQLAPGSTDLKTAQAIKLDSIEIGDRVLITGHTDAPNALTASRVILMKSTDIAQKHASDEEDWQKRGTGGLVSSIDSATGTLTITARKKVAVQTDSSTIYRRYASGSVKFEDAKLSTLDQIHDGDQIRVRGMKSPDGASIKAEEIVSGSFTNLAGTIVSVDATAGTLTIKDAAAKKTYSLKVTSNSSVRALPPEAASRFAARAKGPQSGATPTASSSPSGAGSGPGAGDRAAGGDLSQLISRLPQGSLADLHPGQALMVVASQAEPDNDSLTAITLLSGVESILAATPKGEASMTLSPWSLGGGTEGGGM